MPDRILEALRGGVDVQRRADTSDNRSGGQVE
jgi:hypothetical protein